MEVNLATTISEESDIEVKRVMFWTDSSFARLAYTTNKLSSDVAELQKVIAKNNDEVEKLKKDLVNQNKYVASLQLELGRVKKAPKQQKNDIEDLQETLEQYTRKNSLKFHGIPTDEIVCKVAQAVGVKVDPEKNRDFTSLIQEKGIKPIIAKFANHKDKAKCYTARIRLKDVP